MQMFGNKSARSPTRFPQRSVVLTNLLQLSLFLGPPQFTSLSKNFLFSINNLCMKVDLVSFACSGCGGLGIIRFHGGFVV